MRKLIAVITLLGVTSYCWACETEPMQGYEGPCEIYGRMDASYQYFYTREQKDMGAPTKKWDLATGTVIEEGGPELLQTGIPILDQATETIRTASNSDATFIIRKGRFANNRSTMSYSQVEPGSLNFIRGYDDWFTTNDGFYPVDGNTAWVLQHHDSNFASNASFLSEESKVAGLYLVDLETGDKIRSVFFDKRENPAVIRLREYISLKLEYSREMFDQQVALLSTPDIYLLRPQNNNGSGDTIEKLNESQLIMRSADRCIVYDLDDHKPVRISHIPGWNWTVLSSYAPEQNYTITGGLGESPGTSGNSCMTIHDDSMLEDYFIMAWINDDLAIVANNKGGGEFNKIEIREASSGERVHRLHRRDVRAWELTDSGRYFYVGEGDGDRYVYDTQTGEEVYKGEGRITIAHEGILNAGTGEYIPFDTLEPRQLLWKNEKDYSYTRFQGQYILSFATGQGIEVFDIENNRYITPMPLDTGFHALGTGSEFRGNTMAYFPERNQLVVAGSEGAALYGNDALGKRASAYAIDLDTYALEAINVNAMPWDDPLLTLREGAREADKAEAERRQLAEREKQEQLRLQEQAFMGQLEDQVASYPQEQQIHLFYPDGPLGPYVGNERKAQALVAHMRWWEQPNNHSSVHGLSNVPYAFVEDLIPYLPGEWAAKARSALPTIRQRQLMQQEQAEQNAAVQRMLDNFGEAARNYRAPEGAPSTLDRIHDYQREHYLFGKANRDACSASNPCGPDNQFRAYD